MKRATSTGLVVLLTRLCKRKRNVMPPFISDFRDTWLWRYAFTTPRSDCVYEEQEFLKTQYMSLRDRAAQLVSRIAADLPGLTVHNIDHLDALWETASLFTENAVDVNPAEAFVLGASILLHDAGMSLAAYPGGLEELKTTLAWKDAIGRIALNATEGGRENFDLKAPSEAVLQRAVPEVLRQLHAERAEVLAEQGWSSPDGSKVYLIEDSELRLFYGPSIGQIAHSHWWPVSQVELELKADLGALAHRTSGKVDRVKLACILRLADALHLDSRRAPRFLRSLINPRGVADLHWTFQERMAKPHVDLDAIVFTSGQPFARQDAEAWWLAYDTLRSVDHELHEVDLLLQERGRGQFKVRRVRGANSPEALATTVPTRGWRPVETHIRVSDVSRLVETLGGETLYGNKPIVALRELIQNAADAVEARRRYEKRNPAWGLIQVDLIQDEDWFRLVVEDNGVGMSEQVLTGPLLDFGNSLWGSALASQESGAYRIGDESCWALRHWPFFCVYDRQYCSRVYTSFR